MNRRRKIICADLLLLGELPSEEWASKLRELGADIPEGAVCVQQSLCPSFDYYHWNHNVIGLKFEHAKYAEVEPGQSIPIQHIGH